MPILEWLSQYRFAWLRDDLIAGLTVWAVMVPTALAYTGIAGVPAVVGLYTIPLALLAYAVFGTSRALVVGPDSATALLSAHTVSALMAQHSGDYGALTSSLALLVGVLFCSFGVLRMGWIAHFISQPVMKGFIQGLALVTMMSQLPKLFGVENVGGNFFQAVWALFQQGPNTHLPTLGVGLGSLVLLFALSYFFPKSPAALITVVAAILAVSCFDLHEQGVAIVGVIETGIPPFGLPHFQSADAIGLLQGALAIVLLNYAESLGTAKAAALITGGSLNPNQELVGLGMANLGSSLSSGFVVAGSLSQSAVSMTAGGKTQMAALFHTVFIILTLLFLMPLFKNLPEAALGVIVIKAMIQMLDFGYLKQLRVVSYSEFSLALVVYVGVLALGVLPGIGLGVVFSLIALIYHAAHPGTAILGKVHGKDMYRNVLRRADAKTLPGLLIFRLDSDLFFINADYCAERIRHHVAAAAEPVCEVLIDAETINRIDMTATDMLSKLHTELAQKNTTLSMARVRDSVRVLLKQTEVEQRIGSDHIYDSITQGVKAFCQRTGVPLPQDENKVAGSAAGE
ncbi:SulP family inorganic anion transporter [Candidatus Contendibacter odensensis]|uniref:Sulfate transporter n=1 Tax=Candidatus Contendobacter odensis Run_B_J11 TaxID=1400861 RepID=A0A7U7J4L5_9GAMM|nr:SulP family inorganic anion transporter [Candidatus Contendobacter odensis]CDH45465.1 putative sulfate transporter [Candidatus Contendobacter odensis Run_B_J11]